MFLPSNEEALCMFIFLNKQEKDAWLPKLFDLLYENMQTIAPSEGSYAQEKARWLAEVAPALDKAPRQIIMCFVGGELAGYIQYYIREQMLMVEEIQLKKQYHSTVLFYQLCKHLLTIVPDDLQTIEAYADKRNLHSIRLMEKLGMQPCDAEADCPFVHMRGFAETLYLLFKR